MFQVGEDRRTEIVEEQLRPGRVDEVLSKCAADPATLSVDEFDRKRRKAEALHSKAVDHRVPSPRDGPRLDAVLEAQVAQHLLERQLRQIVHLLRFGSVSIAGSVQVGFDC